jgi:NTP pyrophosphatase (non-canonical NTP hydrolase)
MTDFQTLRKANAHRQRQWDREGKIDIAYRGNELAGECGEACNIVKKIERERRGIRGSRATLAQLADELADVIICVDLIALYEGIDLWESVRKKFNETSVNNGLDTRIE